MKTQGKPCFQGKFQAKEGHIGRHYCKTKNKKQEKTSKHNTIPYTGTVPCVCNPSTQEAEAGELPVVEGQSGLHSEFQTSLGYRTKSYLKNTIARKSILTHYNFDLIISLKSKNLWF